MARLSQVGGVRAIRQRRRARPMGSPAAGSVTDERSGILDAVRIVAALMVLGTHLHRHAAIDLGPLTFVGVAGESGVAVFFVLSGYLLYRPFTRGRVDLRAYAIRRAARILPAYIAAVVVLGIVSGSFDDPWRLATFDQAYDPDRVGNVIPAWSLRVEVQFYAVLPLAAMLLGVSTMDRLLRLAWLAVASLLCILFVDPGLVPIVPFVPGMAVAVLEADPRFRRRSWMLPAGIALIVLGTVLGRIPPIVNVLALVGTALVIAWAVGRRVRAPRWVGVLAAMSYAFYLWHLDIIRLLALGPLEGIPLVVVAVALATVAAAVSWFALERPILRFVHGRTERPVPLPTAEARLAA